MTDRDRLAALLEHTQDVVAVLDEDGRFQYVSPAAESILGFDAEVLIESDAFDYVHPDDREAARSAFADAIATGERREVQHRYRTANDEWVWLETVASGEYDDDLEGYVVTARDVSERERAERERRRTRERLEELTDAADDVLWMFSADWSELLFVNRAYEDIWGRPVEALRADPTDFLAGIYPDHRGRVRDAMDRLSSGEFVELEFRVNESESYGRWVWVKGTPVLDEGTVVRIVGFARDVTERRDYRRQIEVMDRVLRHNLHNDMNVVLGYAEQARAQGDQDVRRDIERTIQRGRDLLGTVSKQREIVELLDPTPGQETVDLASVARSTCAALAESYPDAEVDVDAPDSTPVRAIPEVDHAVEELVDNAIKHADDGASRVRVSVEQNGETAVLEVADDGRGIPEEEIQVLTGERDVEPLYHGSGLGLWLVNWIVRRSDGDLSFEPNEPAGSRVSIRLEPADA